MDVSDKAVAAFVHGFKKTAAELATFGKTHAKANAMAVALRSPGNSAEMKADQQIKVDLYVICRAKREILSEHFHAFSQKQMQEEQKSLKSSHAIWKIHEFWSAPVWKNTQIVPR